MKSEFIKLYEELSQLNESKQDTLNFKQWLLKKGTTDSAADEWVKRFDGIKKYLKAPENDYYFWIKKADIADFYEVVNNTERYLEVKRTKKAEIADGAELVNETEHWKIYHITNFEASQYYGRDSKWCITGVGSYGDRYWRDYTRSGYEFYFIIAKEDYDPRGSESKFAFAILKNVAYYQIFDQQDSETNLEDIPYYKEIKIPNINLDDYESDKEPYFCSNCDAWVDEWDIMWDPSGEPLCDSCWEEKCFDCYKCNTTMFKDDGYEGDGDYYCQDCFNDTFFECSRCWEYGYWGDDHYDEETGEYYCSDCYDDLMEERKEENEILDDFESEDY